VPASLAIVSNTVTLAPTRILFADGVAVAHDARLQRDVAGREDAPTACRRVLGRSQYTIADVRIDEVERACGDDAAAALASLR
jgi:hypothetical protein